MTQSDHTASVVTQLEAVRRLAFHLVRGDDAADDVVQDTCVEALRGGERARHVLPWLRGIVRNRVRRHLRDAERRARRERRASLPEAVPSTLDRVVEVEALQQLMAHVAALPAAQRQAIRLRYLEGRPPREIARALDLPLATVRSHLRRGLAQLRRDLDADHDGDRARWAVLLLGARGVGGGTAAPWASAALPVALLAVALAVGGAWLWLAGGEGPSSAGPSEESAADRAALAAPAPVLGGRAASSAQTAPVAAEAGGLVEEVLAGQVVDARSGAPIAGVRVFVAYPEEAYVLPGRVVRSDADGAFTLPTVCSGKRTVRTIADGYLPTERVLKAGSGPKHVVLRLEAGEEIQGVLTDDAGTEIANGEVWCVEGDPGRAWPVTDALFRADGETVGARARSDGAGRFVLRGLRQDVRYELRAACRGYASLSKGVSAGHAMGGEGDARVRLFRLTCLDLALVDDASGDALPVDFGSVGIRPPDDQVLVPLWDLAWGTREDHPVASGHLRVRFRYREMDPDRHPSTLRFRLQTQPVFHEPTATEVEVPWGSLTRHELRVRRKPELAWQLVRLEAHFRGGRPFEGSLCPFEAWRGGMEMIPFTNGRADRPLHLPVGRRNMVPWVFGPRGGRYSLVLQPEQLEILPQRGEFVASWELAANPVRIRVLDAGERLVEDAAIAFEWLDRPDTGRSDLLHAWDDVGYTDEREQDQGHHLFNGRHWLLAGRWRIHANGYAWGTGAADVTCTGDGTPLEVVVRLEPPSLPSERDPASRDGR